MVYGVYVCMLIEVLARLPLSPPPPSGRTAGFHESKDNMLSSLNHGFRMSSILFFFYLCLCVIPAN